MIDHVSSAVRDLPASAHAYDRILAPLGLMRLIERAATVGFGKRYPEFWLNLLAEMIRSRTTPALMFAGARLTRQPCAPFTAHPSQWAAPVPVIPVRDERR